MYESTPNDVGCLFQYKTSASSTSWWHGVWGANANEFNIWHNYKGLSIKSDGSATINGNLDVGVGASSSTIKTHGYYNDSYHGEHTGNIKIDLPYPWYGFIDIKFNVSIFYFTNKG